ncbi:MULTISPECIES: hypothetical protein [unclassified Paenibacillus]|uniref:GAP1-N2 domain-containing protein n=1 Tax=unclassified Paenibacillus TaxID=185978 RepID=UPI0024050E79|nr:MULTISPECIES: hypothetical protein [unclassified Paenibacillus]MDF9842462.1 hypothetical protein [Paenibacillus sp. PastF-2]MDF9849052.1 hypothetical protein [Paenibacillus sp. PastM-2]MDF9855622.1 hypothetical protein [Paenibacillus sp. PastF-1]MDH6480894.1 hypothetical protein [Paenibacillus sp. PastH-2]MDH6508316.1 hypothetical protein [Paenibacillus sp. PastM-3]
MNRFSGSGITQQMYTRERRGVYRATEGFDTVAKSDSLDHNFVKKILHPFCVYDAPAELSARGEKNEEIYPAALHLFHTETNDTVIGQSRYLAADFTGQRSAFFAHNFIVPPIRSEEIVEHYGDWLHADFAVSHEGEPGGTLPELDQIPVRQRESRPDPLTVLRTLGFTEETFKALLQAVMLSVAGKKKIYIALDVPISEVSRRAAELTEVLFSVLPYDFRRRLGVITYANEPQSRKYIHLTFVEKGSLRPGDRNIEKDYVFDLASGRMLNTDFGGTRQPFAELVWKTLNRKGSMEDYARFADSLLTGEGVDRKLQLAVYNELAVFYEIEQGDEQSYADNKIAVLSGLLSYLKPRGALESRVRLNDLFLERFDREYDAIRQRGIPQPEVLEQFKEYFVLEGHNYRGKIVDYFINGMLNCPAAGREDVLAAAYGIIESNDGLSAAFFKKVLGQPVFRRQLLEPYMESRLAAAADSREVMRFVFHWGRSLPEVLQQSFARDMIKEYLLEKLAGDNNPVAAVAAAHDFVEKAEKERRRGSGLYPEAMSLLLELADAADRFLLSRVDLDELTLEQLLDISFLRYRDAEDWQPPLDSISRRKANALQAAYRWFGEEKPDERIFAGLAPRELDDVQLLGRRWLKDMRSAEPFERLPLAFYHISEREDGPLDYEALLELVVRKAGGDKETVYRFFDWSQGSRLFTVSNKKLWPGYKRAILKYFMNKDREAFKSRDFRKSYAAAAGPALQNVYNEARGKLASPLARWVSRSRFQLLISGSVLGLVIIAVIIAVSLLRPDPADTAQPENGSGAGGASTVTAMLGSGGTAGTRLVFTFEDAAECSAFKPAEIGLMSGDEVTDMYDVVATTGNCLVASPEPGAAATDAAGSGTDGGASGNAGSSTDGGAADNAGTGTDGNAGTGTGDGGESVSSPPSSGQPDAALYQVIVDLEQGAALAAGSMITAGEYKLIVQPAPAAGVTTSPAAQPSATAEATPDASAGTNNTGNNAGGSNPAGETSTGESGTNGAGAESTAGAE